MTQVVLRKEKVEGVGGSPVWKALMGGNAARGEGGEWWRMNTVVQAYR